MGPKGRSRVFLNRVKQVSEIGRVTSAIKKMESKLADLKCQLDTLNSKFADKSLELCSKQEEFENLRAQIVGIDNSIIELRSQKATASWSLLNLTSELKTKQRRLSEKKRKFSLCDLGVSSSYNSKCFSFKISKCKAQKRKKDPFTDDSLPSSKKFRCNESYIACSLIFGGTSENKIPVLNGMLETINRKFKSAEVINALMSSKDANMQKLSRNCINSWHNSFYCSDENKLRSLSIYYSHYVMGKNKYSDVRIANQNSMFQNQKVANYLPYRELAIYMASLDIGVVLPICPNLVKLDEVTDDKPVGMFRDVGEYILRLASFYLKIDKYREDKLLEFPNIPKKDPASFLFVISFGGDGAPGVGTIFLVSFINVGKRSYSSSETFMVFGGDVGENSLPVRRFLEKAMLSFIYLQSKVFSLVIGEEIVKVEFSLTELPNDMKMLSFLSGELSNAATYFTTFANVNTNNYRDYEKTFGKDWIPFSYDKRVSDSKKVAKFKSVLDKTTNLKVTKRAKVTKFIASLKSRQEEEPLVKHFVSNAKCEPLHLKNNVCKDLFMKMWHVIYAPL